MDNNVVSLFIYRKKRDLSTYTNILVKYILKDNITLNKIINKIIEIYIDNFYLEHNTNFTLLSKYFEIKESKESIMKDVLLSAILFYKNSGLEKQISNDIKSIVMLSNLIYLAINLDNCVNEYKNESIEVDERINNYKSKYQNKIRIANDKLELLFTDLTKEIKKNTSAEKKYWKNLYTDSFILSFNNIINQENYFKVNYNYNIKGLGRYNKEEVESVSLTKGIQDNIIYIYLEQLTIIILKNLLNHQDNYFFINIYCDYFNKNKNLLNLDRLYENKSIKKHLIFCFSYEEAQNNMNVIKYLNNKNFQLGLIDIKMNSKLESDTFDMFNYVFITKDIYNNYNKWQDVWTLKKINFIFDKEATNILSTNDILDENR